MVIVAPAPQPIRAHEANTKECKSAKIDSEIPKQIPVISSKYSSRFDGLSEASKSAPNKDPNPEAATIRPSPFLCISDGKKL
jgi:hypothetical protein